MSYRPTIGGKLRENDTIPCRSRMWADYLGKTCWRLVHATDRQILQWPTPYHGIVGHERIEELRTSDPEVQALVFALTEEIRSQPLCPIRQLEIARPRLWESHKRTRFRMAWQTESLRDSNHKGLIARDPPNRFYAGADDSMNTRRYRSSP
jgi:hypothetical protein